MMADSRPIGVFDSGIGGLTVVRELRRQLPNESIIYFGDTARVPYGNKSPQTVIRYAIEAASLLLTYDVKAVVVACNTASAHAMDILKEKFSIPVFGVIQPGVDQAVKVSKNNKILVIGTIGTIRSEAYQNRLRNNNENLKISSQPCPMFVPLVEEGWLNNEITKSTIDKYLGKFKDEGIDTVILGCTHYPLLKIAIDEYWPEVYLVDSGVETAKMLSSTLQNLNKEMSEPGQGQCRFLVSDIADNFQAIGQMFLGTSMENFEIIDMEKFLMENKTIFDEMP